MLLVTQMMMMMRRGVAVPRANVNAVAVDVAILCLLQLLQALLVASRTCWSISCGFGVAGDDREEEQQQQRKDAAERGQSHCEELQLYLDSCKCICISLVVDVSVSVARYLYLYLELLCDEISFLFFFIFPSSFFLLLLFSALCYCTFVCACSSSLFI